MADGEDRLTAPERPAGKAPAPRPAVADLQRRFEKIAHNDAALVEAMNRFADLTPDETQQLTELVKSGDRTALKARGWTLKAIQTALLARLPKSTVPFALQAAHERTGMRIRRMQPKAAGARVNVAIIQISERAPRKTDAEVEIVEDKG